ncbi:MAG TPA: O-antigen ligase family protein [Longimicrobiaceae bacterium]|nr:O-antigen ligase family protein [Longimicrobiaceae bacterium]
MIPYRALGLLFILDQLLLPMPHIAGMPFKLTYLFLGVWLVDLAGKKLVREADARRYQEFLRVALYFLGIIAAAVVGELWTGTRIRVPDHGETYRSIAIYLLMLLSFGLGLSAYQFRMRWLLHLLYVSVAANLIVVFFGRYFPGLVLLYYDATTTGADVLDAYRPRGLLGNPNVSMLHVNLVMLFVVIAQMKGYLELGVQRAVITLALPIVTALVLATRTELLVSIILGAALLNSIARQRGNRPAQRLLIGGAALVSAGLLFVAVSFVAANNELILTGLERVTSTRGALLDVADRNSSILRPLLVWEIVYARFMDSPFFGTGFNRAQFWPYNYSPLYYHNDWFRVLVTSGLAGFLLFVLLVRRIWTVAGGIAVLPFFLPALTNTFILAIPASMFYFFMIGVITERRRLGEAPQARPVPAAAPVPQPVS